MDKILEQLARLLGVTTDGLQGVMAQIGGNYQEIYQLLVKEYALYSVLNRFSTIVYILTSISVIGCVILNVCWAMDGEYLPDNLVKGVKVFNKMTLCLIPIAILTCFFPLFYPNLNLILGLLDK